MANTLRVGPGMGLRLWRDADLGLNYARGRQTHGGTRFADRALTFRQSW